MRDEVVLGQRLSAGGVRVEARAVLRVDPVIVGGLLVVCAGRHGPGEQQNGQLKTASGVKYEMHDICI